MKVYTLTSEVKWDESPFFDAEHRFDRDGYYKAIEDHKAKVKAWLLAHGYKGKNTGRIVRFPVADGYAEYMIAEGGRKSGLIHLPYGDGYDYRDVEFLPKKEILRRADRAEGLAKLFASKR